MLKKREKHIEKKAVPKSVQAMVPIKIVYDDGIFQTGRKQYSQTYRFTDINYAVASYEDKIDMLKEYISLLNSLEPGVMTKITINNRRLNRNDFERDVLLKEKDDGVNHYRKAYNAMLLNKAACGSTLIQERYITITVTAENIEEAKLTLQRIGNGLASNLGRLGADCIALNGVERLRVFMISTAMAKKSILNLTLGKTEKGDIAIKTISALIM